MHASRVSHVLALVLALLGPLGVRAQDDGFAPSPEAARMQAFLQLHDATPADAPLAPGGIRVRHPVVMAHGAIWLGALGLDSLSGDYWSGVVQRFQELGVPTISPQVNPAGSIQERAAELKAAIDRVFPRGKVNILAHSMGGLDARYMIKMLGMGHRVASLTTISTPHRGSWYADFADAFILKGQGLEYLAKKAKVNHQAVQDLSVHHMQNYFNPVVTDHPSVAYFSYAGVTDLWHLPLYQWGAKLVVSVAEQAAVGKSIGRATRAALEKAIPGGHTRTLGLIRDGGARLDWIDPAQAGRSDGVVSVSSAKWGTYLGEIQANHLAQIGTSRRVDHKALWEGVLRRLSSLGY